MATSIIGKNLKITVGSGGAADEPAEGSVSMGVDESGIVYAKLESGETIAVKGDVIVTLEYQTFGTGTPSAAVGQTVTLAADSGTAELTKAVVIVTPTWGDTGFRMKHKIVGVVGSIDAVVAAVGSGG